MKLITTHDRVAGVADAWKEQYRAGRRSWGTCMGGSAQPIWEQLKALPPTATEADVVAIVGNHSWTYLGCDECGERTGVIVRFHDVEDHDSSTVDLCPSCLRKALALVSANERAGE